MLLTEEEILLNGYCLDKNGNMTLKLNEVFAIKLISKNLKKIPDLSKFKNTLEELDLSDNNIREIENLEELTKLKILKIENNNLLNIKNIEKCLNIIQLYLKNNHITTLKDIKFNKKLKILDLSHNKLSCIDFEKKILKYLEELHLNNNYIERIENLDYLIKLNTLNLSHNIIRYLEGLKKLINLETLFLHNNSIKYFDNSLEGLNKLIFLSLARNKIHTIGKFSRLPKLKIFNLSYNEIDTIENLEVFEEYIESHKNLEFLNSKGIFETFDVVGVLPNNDDSTESFKQKMEIFDSLTTKNKTIRQKIDIYLEFNPLKYSKIQTIKNQYCNIYCNYTLEELHLKFILKSNIVKINKTMKNKLDEEKEEIMFF